MEADEYDDYKVLPGFAFWMSLAKTKQEKLNSLKIRIPETIVVLQNNSFCWLRTDEATGKVKKLGELEANLNDFEKTLIESDPFFS